MTRDNPQQRADEAAFARFMTAYQDMVYSTALRLTGDAEQAADIAQQTFIRAWDRFAELSASNTAGGWLKTVATNLAINHLQRYRKRWRFFSEMSSDDDGEEDEPLAFADGSAAADTERQVAEGEYREVLERALAGLPAHQRLPLVLFHIEGLSLNEVCERLKISLAKLKTDLFRGRAALQLALGRQGIDLESL